MQPWEQLYDKVTTNSLQQVRDAAGKWTNIFSALVGVSTIVGLTQGRDTLSKLNTGMQILFAVVFTLAILTTVTAVFLAALASEGTPQDIPRDQHAFDQWYKNAKRKAINYLQLSRALALVAVLFLLGMLFIAWFGPGQPSTGTSVLVAQKSGKVFCGSLMKDKAGNLALTSANLPPIPLTDAVSINIVSNCP